MPLRALFAARPERWQTYEPLLNAAFAKAGLELDLVTEAAPESVDYIIYAPNGPVRDFSGFTKCKAVLNLWAGVEDVVGNPTLTQPLARMVDPGLTEGMVEWCVGHTLRHHLHMDDHIHGQDGIWRAGHVPPLARDRVVTVLGLGELGMAVAEALAALRFNVRGWARRPKEIAGVQCYHGTEGLRAALSRSEVVVLLLPSTPQTENIVNATTLDLLAQGAFILNPGRGGLIEDNALLAALDNGQIAHATLDVFRAEPLDPAHAYWAHPKVTVTPHIASETRARTASEVIAENIRRGEAGLPFLHLVDRQAGY